MASKRLHIIGVSGVTMAPLAVLYKEMGWHVTGSDRAFFPPMSTYLENNGITIMPGFKVEHLDPKPDLVLVMAFITKNNPELKYVIEQGIPYKAYAEVLPDLIEQKNSIVIAGSRGKTSTTALATWVFETAGLTPNFMIGGIAKNFPDGIRKTDSEWSIMEGDEYPVASWKKEPKFLEYNPKYLILTGATWDHMDIYPSKKAYLDIFQSLIKKMPKDGVIIANAKGENIENLLEDTDIRVVWYNNEEEFPFTPPYKGRGWDENSRAVAALAREAGVSNEHIQRAFDTFEGIKRRQEVRYKLSDIVIIDDNAHSPEKVEGVLETLHEQYPVYEILAVYEPGSRNTVALQQDSYKTCFQGASYIILPRVSAASKSASAFNERLYELYHQYYPNMEYLPEDKQVLESIKETTAKWRQEKKKGIVVFMSQKGFRGMIEETISALKIRLEEIS